MKHRKKKSSKSNQAWKSAYRHIRATEQKTRPKRSHAMTHLDSKPKRSLSAKQKHKQLHESLQKKKYGKQIRRLRRIQSLQTKNKKAVHQPSIIHTPGSDYFQNTHASNKQSPVNNNTVKSFHFTPYQSFLLTGIVILSAIVFLAGILANTKTEMHKAVSHVLPHDDLPVLNDVEKYVSPLIQYPPYLSLEETLTYIADEVEGDCAIYVENLSDGTIISINSHRMSSASLIKLFTAGRYFDAIENGEIRPSEAAEKDLSAMISWSDNTAWVDLETYIGAADYNAGLQSVNTFAQEYGYLDTGRLISDGEGDFSNYTSVNDVGRVLRNIYNGIYVNKEASETILRWMKEQVYTQKIPAGLPDEIMSANKTGELIGVENDAAIVYGPDCDYILVVMIEDMYQGDPTAIINEISKIVYDALSPSQQE